jgi:hypothetical protein
MHLEQGLARDTKERQSCNVLRWCNEYEHMAMTPSCAGSRQDEPCSTFYKGPLGSRNSVHNRSCVYFSCGGALFLPLSGIEHAVVPSVSLLGALGPFSQESPGWPDRSALLQALHAHTCVFKLLIVPDRPSTENCLVCLSLVQAMG